MPELPEVERAARLFHQRGKGKVISRVETTEDTIVFQGVIHNEFADEIRGRRITSVKRYGKVFYVELDGKGRVPVLHFGMTGNVIIKGEVPLYYKGGPKKGEIQWPPRFVKFILHLSDSNQSSSSTKKSKGNHDESETQIAFVDARRLGRIRLCQDPLKEPPISALGFDPILSMPSLDEFSEKVLKRSCPIKALLLDQSFSAGVGNWVADEILYHSRVHPEQRCNSLSPEQVTALHKNTSYVCETAVSVNADSHQFPDNWLFKHRWGKGKRKTEHKETLKLPSGEPATIKWLTVGGRTSAYVVELQNSRSAASPVETGTDNTKIEEHEDGDESDLIALSDLDIKKFAYTDTDNKGPKSRITRSRTQTRFKRSQEVIQNEEDRDQEQGQEQGLGQGQGRKGRKRQKKRSVEVSR